MSVNRSLRRISDWIRGNVLGVVAIFIALSGTAYATHPGGANTISSGDIIDDEVRAVDIRTNAVQSSEIDGNAVNSAKIAAGAVQSVDVRDDTVNNGGLNAEDLNPGSVGASEVTDNSLTGADVNELTLGKVPNADRLDGIDSTEFAPANPAATVDVAEGAPETTVLKLADLGELVVLACDTTDAVGLNYAWRNTSDTGQDAWADLADTDDPTVPPQYGLVEPENQFQIVFSSGEEIMTTFRIRPVNEAGVAATIDMFAKLGVPDACRVSAQAVLSG